MMTLPSPRTERPSRASLRPIFTQLSGKDVLWRSLDRGAKSCRNHEPYTFSFRAIGLRTRCVGATKKGNQAIMVQEGTVRGFNEEKGYGFVVADGSYDELFVHYTDVTGEGYRSLKQGERVAFEVGDQHNRRGPRARNVRKVRS
jgi:CspA family cold shock protein